MRELLEVPHSEKIAIATNYVRKSLIPLEQTYSENEFIPQVDTSVTALLEAGVQPKAPNYTGDTLIDTTDVMINKRNAEALKDYVATLYDELETTKVEIDRLEAQAQAVENSVIEAKTE